MSALVFLLGALVISLVGSLIWWLSQRPPTSLESSVDTFNRRLDALGRRAAQAPDEREYGPEHHTEPGSGLRSIPASDTDAVSDDDPEARDP